MAMTTMMKMMMMMMMMTTKMEMEMEMEMKIPAIRCTGFHDDMILRCPACCSSIEAQEPRRN